MAFLAFALCNALTQGQPPATSSTCPTSKGLLFMAKGHRLINAGISSDVPSMRRDLLTLPEYTSSLLSQTVQQL